MKPKYKILILLALIAATAVSFWYIKNKNFALWPVVEHKTVSGFAGQWTWQDPQYTSIELSNGEEEYQEASLGLNLKVDGKNISGVWTGSFYDNSRLDGCTGEEKNRPHEAGDAPFEEIPCISGQLAGNTAEIVFLSDYNGATGKAKLIYNPTDDTLTWKITQNPEGEFYAPKEAVLERVMEGAFQMPEDTFKMAEYFKNYARIPARLPLTILKNQKLFASIKIYPQKYSIKFEKTNDCGGADACFVGYISGSQNTALDDTVGDKVTLAKNIAGIYAEGTCGGSCVPNQIEWIENNTLYTIQWNTDKKNLVNIANSAIISNN